MKIITHPDNVELLRRRTRQPDKLTELLSGRPTPFGIEIVTNRYMERERPSGRIILPNGTAVDRNKFQIRTRFITYGPEDLHYFLWTGEVREEMEPVFFVMRDELFPTAIFTLPVFDPRRVLVTGGA